MNINKKKFTIQIIKASLIPLFVSGVGGKQAKNIFIFLYDIISTHFCAPNASKSGTSFKVSYNRTRNNEFSWSGHSEFTIKLRGMGRRVCLLSKLENTCLSKRISPSCRPIRTMENMTSSLSRSKDAEARQDASACAKPQSVQVLNLICWKCCASFLKPIDENGSRLRISGTGCKGDYRQSKAEPM